MSSSHKSDTLCQLLCVAMRASAPGEAHAALVGSRGHVTVDARFDAGFFVTVQLGRDMFRGMLYYPPPEHTVGAGEAPVVGPPPPAPPRASTAGTPAVTIAVSGGDMDLRALLLDSSHRAVLLGEIAGRESAN